jgi:DNA-directed RNA polymerase specialized sigma24 family protein
VELTWDVADETCDGDLNVRDIPPEALHECIRNLPPGYRAVLNLYVFENHTHEEIAQMLRHQKGYISLSTTPGQETARERIKRIHDL